MLDSAGATERPIIVVKRRRRDAGGHHGGAWKVAYADFVTAMMAFFLVMWLVATISNEQRAALFDYFRNPSMDPGASTKPAPAPAGAGGASASPIDLGGSPRVLRDPPAGPPATPAPPVAVPATPAATTDTRDAARLAEEAEHRSLEALMADLTTAIAKSEALAPFRDQLLLDVTAEGLRIQIVDKGARSMFDLGSSTLKDYTENILHELALHLNKVPNRLSVGGHTDAKPWAGRRDYSNWELSADRANSARRALIAGGLDPEKIMRVVGLSSSVLFDAADPENPANRRISIVVMKEQFADSILKNATHAESAAAP